MKDYEENETLGSCGCVDYHMADCPLRTSHLAMDIDVFDPFDGIEGY